MIKKGILYYDARRKFPWRSLFSWLLVAVLIPVSLTAYVLLTLPEITNLETQVPQLTSFMKYRQRQAAKKGEAYSVRCEWVDFDRIPPLFKEAVRITEDAGFYWHKGIDMEELKESIKRDWNEWRFVRGGSTITQQLAKNLYLSPQRNPVRKLREIFIARRLESTLSKERIFSLYLNLIEFGPGLFGVQAASRHYFSKDVSDLSMEEIVRLTAIIPRPLLHNPRFSGKWFNWRCRYILGKLKLYKKIGEEDYQSLIGTFK